MLATVERFFKLKENNTNVKTEFIAGLTTFMTMSYIIFVEPTILHKTGMSFHSVMVATCISSMIGTILMGILANYPIALGAAMGHNFYFTFTVCGAATMGGLAFGWPAALAAVFVAGVLYLLLTFSGIREMLLNLIPMPLKYGIVVGIGLFITFIGLQWSGLIVASPGTLVKLGNVTAGPVLLSVFSMIIITIMLAKKINGAILYGILITIIIGIPLRHINYHGIIDWPYSIEPTFMKLDFQALFSHPHFIDVIFVFLFLALFDTMGTIIGIGQQAGFLKEDGSLPRSDKALQADAGSAVIGSVLGCSTITCYIESSAGVSAGGRTGLANMFTAFMFFLAIFFAPLAQSVGEGYLLPDGTRIYPAIAAALIIVGSFMMKNIKNLNWDDITDVIPAFLCVVAMPFAFSITEGISWGFISYVILKVATGKAKEIHWLIYLFSILFIVRYIFLMGH